MTSKPSEIADGSVPAANESEHAGRTAPLEVGQRVAGRYVITQVVGSGGMGVVYRAVEEDIERDVALKFIMLDPSLSEVERQAYNERFLNEAQALGKLPPHPNRVVLYQYGYDEDSELNFMAMELVRGEQLSNFMFKRSFTRDTVVSYTRQMAMALEDVHASNLIHRDLKPENLIVTRSLLGDEQLKLIDFGIAKQPQRVKQDEDESEDRELLGTILYMAPELLLDGVEDARTDIYAIGVILFQLVTGRGPFDHLIAAEDKEPDIMEMVRHHAESKPGSVTPRAGVGEIPDAFAHIIHRCLAKKPEQRFANASELLKALDDMGEHKRSATMVIHKAEMHRVEDDGPQADVYVVPSRDAGPAVTATAICGSCNLVASADVSGTMRVWDFKAGYEVLTVPPPPGDDRARDQMRLSFAPGGNLIALGDLTVKLYLVDTEVGTRDVIALSEGCPKAVSFDKAVSLMVVATDSGTLELWDVPNRKRLASLSFEVSQAADARKEVVDCLALAPSRSHLVAGTEGGLLYLWNFNERDKTGPLKSPPPVPDSHPAKASDHPAAVVYIGFSEDGEKIAVVRAGGHLELWEPEDRSLVWRISLPLDEVPRRLLVSPHNDQILVAYNSGSVVMVEVATGAVLDVIRIPRGRAVNLSFSSDGEAMASIAAGSTVQIWNLSRVGRVRTVGPHGTTLLDVTIGMKGATAYSLAAGGFIDRWDLLSGRHLGRQQTGATSARTLNKAPETGRVLLCDPDKGLVAMKGLDVHGVRPLVPDKLPLPDPGGDRVTNYAISNDTRLVALGYESGRVQIFAYREVSEPTTLQSAGAPVTAVAFTPDNRSLAVADAAGRLRLWDLPAVQVDWEDSSGRLPIHFLAFTPSGRLLSVPRGNTIEIWNVDKKKRVARLTGHDGPIRTMVHALDGRLLLSASDDRTARLWDVAQQRSLRVLDGHPGPVTAATLDPALRFLLTTSGPYLSIWRVSDAALLASFVYRGTPKGEPEMHRWLAFTPNGHYCASELDMPDLLLTRPGSRRPLTDDERAELNDPRAVAARLILGYEYGR